MRILYIAYSCSPFHGSEDKIGWKVPLEAAKCNTVIVITKEEQRIYIEEFLREHILENIRFVYVDIPSVWKKLFRGTFYSGRLAVWNRAAFETAKDVCKKERIDIIHQIAPVEFRNIGNYAKIPGVKFVCGPIAGGQETVAALRSYARHHAAAEIIRSMVNIWCKSMYRASGRLDRCDHLFVANRETWDYLNYKKPLCCQSSVLTDVSVDRDDLVDLARLNKPSNQKCKFLVVGRLVYLKGHAFLLDVFKQLPSQLEYECIIVGDGVEADLLRQRCSDADLLDKVTFLGPVAHTEMAVLYQQADVLIMPSLREATGSVLLEAMANGLPVVTINRFGGAEILDESTGWLYDGEDREACISGLKAALICCITQPEEVVRRGINARKEAEKYTWDERMKNYQAIYENVIGQCDVGECDEL